MLPYTHVCLCARAQVCDALRANPALDLHVLVLDDNDIGYAVSGCPLVCAVYQVGGWVGWLGGWVSGWVGGWVGG